MAELGVGLIFASMFDPSRDFRLCLLVFLISVLPIHSSFGAPMNDSATPFFLRRERRDKLLA